MNTPNPIDYARMAHFAALSQPQQAEAIRRMAAQGWSDHGISSATCLAVEFVRRVIGDRRD